jgi:glycerol uptake operon antiterminator
MITQSSRSLLTLLAQCPSIPIITGRTQFAPLFAPSSTRAILLRHCNLFDLAGLLEQIQQRRIAVYVNVDHIDGIAPDASGLHYMFEQFHIAGVASNHPKILSMAKGLGLETIQRIFAVDSTGLEMALDSVDRSAVDVLDVSPALVIPHILPHLTNPLPLPFIGSGLIQTFRQKQAILQAGAAGVAVVRSELWR